MGKTPIGIIVHFRCVSIAANNCLIISNSITRSTTDRGMYSMGKTPIGIIVHFRSHYTFHVVVEIIGGLSPCLFAWEGFYTSINFR